jgi:uncharacterized protein YukE
MSNPGFHISEQTLTGAINGVNSAAANMRPAMSTIEGQLAALNGSYQGQQKLAFDKVQTTAQDFGARLGRDLTTMEQLITEAGKSYGGGDSDVAEALANLANHDPSGYAGGTGGTGLGI